MTGWVGGEVVGPPWLLGLAQIVGGGGTKRRMSIWERKVRD